MTAETTPDRLAPVRSFNTGGGDTSRADREELPFEIDGSQQLAYVPTGDQAAMLARMASRSASLQDKIQETMRFLEGVTSPATFSYLEGRTYDGGDRFGFTELAEIMVWLCEETAARATAQPEAPRNGPALGRGGKVPAKKATAPRAKTTARKR